MISLKRKQSGFTIVELLIVIVVIGILAALVVTTFAGVQRKARNAERESDIKAIHTQLEAYYNEANRYPTLAELNGTSGTIRQNEMKSLDAGALRDPRGNADTLCATVSATCYGYAVNNDGTEYTLSADIENSDTNYEKRNLN